MKNFKFTGVNIAAALLILAYFFPWVSGMPGLSMSGFSLTTTGISPGMLNMLLHMNFLTRLFVILLVVIPLSGALILYQNVTGNMKYDKYFKLAHVLPVIVLIVGVVALYFKMQPDTSSYAGQFGQLMGQQFQKQMEESMKAMAPGLFDILGIGVYASLLAGAFLFLNGIGKVKDKEYFRAQPNISTPSNLDQK